MHSAKYVYHTGTSASSIARAGTSCEMIQQKTRSTSRPCWISSQNQAYNPFSPESKNMIQDVGNIELCELLETDPKTQCTACLSYWNVGIVYCTCGHFLQKETEANRHFIKTVT